jgi:hypothetical protein
MLPSALSARQCQKLQISEPPGTDRRVIGIPTPDRFGREIHTLTDLMRQSNEMSCRCRRFLLISVPSHPIGSLFLFQFL